MVVCTPWKKEGCKAEHFNKSCISKSNIVYLSIGSRLTATNYTTLILAAWINALFWASMPVVGKNDTSFVSYTMSVIAVNFVIPLSVMFYCYYNVSKTMKYYMRNSCLENINIDWSDQVDVTKMSVVMIIMFLLAWSPYSIVCLWSSFGDPKKISPAMAIVAPLFAKSSTFYNPCIYVIANKR
uniref:G-protein coupled receptors family 1 profile domain-containing protein n=1 Tax=Anolis carolinensis TaxID=28377 RepID=A0A803SRH6_ANOCA